jgi:hypothetical protein
MQQAGDLCLWWLYCARNNYSLFDRYAAKMKRVTQETRGNFQAVNVLVVGQK